MTCFSRKRGDRMDKYLSPAAVAEILDISRRKAYDIMYQMPYLPGPLRVSERDLRHWIETHTVYPAVKRRRAS